MDYEIDELQGRLILTRPLSQLTRENVRSLTRDTPLDGYDQLLLVDYEYVPQDFSSDDAPDGGLRGNQWIGDHVAVGRHLHRRRPSGGDYSASRAPTSPCRPGRGTYLKVEQTRTEATAAPVFYSDNGGLSFVQPQPVRSGGARATAGRWRCAPTCKRTGLDQRRTGASGAWWRDVDAGFSVSRFDTGSRIQEYGAEFLG